jgi:hypothetical protein
VFVAEEEIAERHPERPMLHLPHMAELVRDEFLLREQVAGTKQDRLVGGIPLEAAKPREPEEPGHDPDADAVERHRPRIERQRVEALLRADECGALQVVHAPTL